MDRIKIYLKRWRTLSWRECPSKSSKSQPLTMAQLSHNLSSKHELVKALQIKRLRSRAHFPKHKIWRKVRSTRSQVAARTLHSELQPYANHLHKQFQNISRKIRICPILNKCQIRWWTFIRMPSSRLRWRRQGCPLIFQFLWITQWIHQTTKTCSKQLERSNLRVSSCLRAVVLEEARVGWRIGAMAPLIAMK